jgi:hypothetical protein
MKMINIISLIIEQCARDDLSTWDPYDIWKSRIGFAIKNYYNHHKILGLPFAGLATVYDIYVNNRFRIFYRKQEYPIVRAMASLALMNMYKRKESKEHLQFAEKHIRWLLDHTCKGYSGKCWGINFKYPVDKCLVYNENTPFVTITPYILEALHQYALLTKDPVCIDAIKSVFRFFKNDIKVLYENTDSLATSYGPFKDRIVINALSYTMYSYALLARYHLNGEDRDFAESTARKLYQYIINHQHKNGSWMYSVEDNSFIDCFHSCFVVKNVIKANACFKFPNAQSTVVKGYNYVKKAFWVESDQLFKRFSLTNKMGIAKYDLYDNAEALNLAVLMKDKDLIWVLLKSIYHHFYKDGHFFSMLDVFGMKKNRDMMRWAFMPLLYVMSSLDYASEN